MKTLGLDIGTTSVGWSLNTETEIIASGVHIFPVGVQDDTYGKSQKEESKAVARRLSRMAARLNTRYKLRRAKLEKFRKEHNWPEPANIQSASELYGLRKRALDQQIDMAELVRLLFLFNQRRGFKSSRKAIKKEDEKERTELKAKMNSLRDKIMEQGFRTIGEYFYSLYQIGEINHPNYQPNTPNGLQQPAQRIRTSSVLRELYVNELALIWKKQAEFYPELTDGLHQQVSNEIIYYQRKLKPASHLKANCRFEPAKKVVPRSHPHFQEFRMWQTMRNLRIENAKTDADSVLTLGEMKAMAEFLTWNPKISQKEAQEICKGRGIKPEFSGLLNDLRGILTWCQIAEAIGLDETKKMDEVKRLQLWDALNFFDDPEKLKKHLVNTRGFSPEQAEKLAEVSLEQDYASVSHKAIMGEKIDRETGEVRQGILYYLKQGFLYNEACEKAGYRFNVLANDTVTVHKLLDDVKQITIQHFGESRFYGGEGIDIPNSPLVKRVISETLRVVRKVFTEFGRPDIIRVELARTLQKPKDKREAEKAANDKKDALREIYRKFLRAWGLNGPINKEIMQKFELWLELECTTSDLENRLKEAGLKKGQVLADLKKIDSKAWEKYKLWLETDRISIYSGQPISLTDLFDRDGTIEIEHIIPYSFCQDDSFANKSLCERNINRLKGQRTACEYFKSLGKAEFTEFRKRVIEHVKSKRKQRAFLLDIAFASKNPESLSPEENAILNRFRPDALAATAYATRKLVEMLHFVSPKVYVTSGGVTAKLRHEWNLNELLSLSDNELAELDKLADLKKNKVTLSAEQNKRLTQLRELVEKNRDDHRHHALDAIVIAFSNQALVQKLNTATGNNAPRIKTFRNGGKEVFIDFPNPLNDPWEFKEMVKKALANMLVSRRQDTRIASVRLNPYRWASKEFKAKMRLPENQNKVLAPRGPLHAETIYGKVAGQPNLYVTRWPLSKFETKKQLEKVADPAIKLILLEAAKNGLPFKEDKEKGDYGIYLPVKKEGKEHTRVPIKSVRIHVKASNMVALPRGYAEADGNYGVGIYTDSMRNREELMVTFFQAFARYRQREPIFPATKDYDPAQTKPKKQSRVLKLILTLRMNDMVVMMDKCPVKLEELTNPAHAAAISPYLYRVQNLSSYYYVMRHHLASTLKHDFEMRRFQSLDSLKLARVKVDVLGRIVKVLEHI